MLKYSVIKDRLNLLSKLTFRRIFNASKIYTGFYLSSWLKKPIQWGLPVSLSFEPTTSCNLRCPECPSGLRSFTRPTGMLQQELFTKTIDEISPDLIYLIFYFQGEPYLNPSFLEMVRYASKKGLYTATSTNAHYLKSEVAKKTVESGLDRLIVSIDGTSQETYSSYRIGGQLEKVIEGTKQIIHWKKELNSATPHIIFQFLVTGQNEHQMDEVLKIGEELGVDEVLFKTAQIYDYENGNPLIPQNERYSRYKKMPDGTYRLKNKLLNRCWKLWHSCVITWDGKVVPCCFDKDASHPMGKVNELRFKDVWFSEPYNAFRTLLLKSRSDIEICKNCTEGTTVWTD